MTRNFISSPVGNSSKKRVVKDKPQEAIVSLPQIEPNTPAIGFSMKLILGDKEYTSEGSTAFEALKNLKKPTKIVSKGTLTISKGEQSHEVYLTIPRAKRLFYSPSTQQILAKQYSSTLK